MSWCGGGEMSITPSLHARIEAMYAFTLAPGSWPPSPGFAPCAILISICSADMRYAGVTPKRPDATCLILDEAMSPSCSPLRCGQLGELPWSSESETAVQRASSSPPSPEFERAPARFTPIASVSCASRERAPSDMPPVANRLMMASTGSTLSIEIGSRSDTISSMSRSVAGGAAVTASLNSLYWSRPLSQSPASYESSALCSILDIGGVFSWCSFFA
mmetsp:Transcript_36669/g.121495  ORF Transcript_36669/g.121495 Transcript_36669/m.121495 type:complete len:218 (-) Transcript_36669:895-1548(-)